ncbi:MAG: anti-sigma factor antagonist [Clostridia bacterium]|nr:anti-sigma factor antagonist [Clostridia bacterium]
MAVEIKMSGEVITAHLSGEIDHHSALGLRRAIDSSIELNMPSLVILDFERVSFMDSSGIGLIMGRYKNLSKRGASLNICGVNPRLYKMMHLSGIERIVRIDKPQEKENNNG